MEKAVVIMIVVLVVVVGVALLGFAEDVGIKVGQDTVAEPAVSAVKELWEELTAPVSLDWDGLTQ